LELKLAPAINDVKPFEVRAPDTVPHLDCRIIASNVQLFCVLPPSKISAESNPAGAVREGYLPVRVSRALAEVEIRSAQHKPVPGAIQRAHIWRYRLIQQIAVYDKEICICLYDSIAGNAQCAPLGSRITYSN
jgi:hypothetical protein